MSLGKADRHGERCVSSASGESEEALVTSSENVPQMVSPEEAAAAVQDGDLIYAPLAPFDYVLDAIVARRDLKHVAVRLTTASQDPGWLSPEPGDERFTVDFQTFVGAFARFATDSFRASYLPNLFSTGFKQLERPQESRFPDVFITRVSAQRARVCELRSRPLQ